MGAGGVFDPGTPLEGHRQLSIHPPEDLEGQGQDRCTTSCVGMPPPHVNLRTNSALPPGQGQQAGVFQGGKGQLWLEEETHRPLEIQKNTHGQGHSLETNPL